MHFLLSSFGYIIYYFFSPLPPGAAGVHKMGPPHDADESDKSAPEAGPPTTQRSGQALGGWLCGVGVEDNLFVEAVCLNGGVYHCGGRELLCLREGADKGFTRYLQTGFCQLA